MIKPILNKSKCCHICKNEFNENDKGVRDHDHKTRCYRGAAHDRCNIDEQAPPRDLPQYEGDHWHLIIKQAYEINKDIGNKWIDAIPKSFWKSVWPYQLVISNSWTPSHARRHHLRSLSNTFTSRATISGTLLLYHKHIQNTLNCNEKQATTRTTCHMTSGSWTTQDCHQQVNFPQNSSNNLLPMTNTNTPTE